MHALWPESHVPPLPPVGQTCAHNRIAFMVTHCQQFFNRFSASSPPVWQRVGTISRPLSPWRLARLQRVLQAASRPSQCLPTPLLHMTCMHPLTQRATARPWWAPRSPSVLDDDASMPGQQPGMAAAYLVARDCPAGIIGAQGIRCSWCRVPTGEAPRTYWRGIIV